MELVRLSMDYPSPHNDVTIFSLPLCDARSMGFHFCALVPSFLFTCIVSRIIVLYCTVSYSQSGLHTSLLIRQFLVYITAASWSGGCVPRICLNSCDLVRAESTERRALILGSPRFCKQSRASPTAVFESAKLRMVRRTKPRTNT